MKPGTLNLIALALAALPVVALAATNSGSARTDFGTYEILASRNIFDAGRSVAPANPPVTPPKIDSFTLTGTLTSGEGHYAFFEGNVIQRRRAVFQSADRVEGFTIAGITKDGVVLESAGNPEILLPVGMELTRKDGGPWKLASASTSAKQR